MNEMKPFNENVIHYEITDGLWSHKNNLWAVSNLNIGV